MDIAHTLLIHATLSCMTDDDLLTWLRARVPVTRADLEAWRERAVERDDEPAVTFCDCALWLLELWGADRYEG